MNGEAFNEMNLGVAEKYEAAFRAIHSGQILDANEDELADHARALASYHVSHAGQDQIAAVMLIHSLQLSHSAKKAERQARRIILLTVGLLILTVALLVYTAFLYQDARQHHPPERLPTQAIELPEDAQALFNLGTYYIAQRKYSVALPVLRKARSLGPQDFSILSALSDSAEHVGNFNEALTARYGAVMSLIPEARTVSMWKEVERLADRAGDSRFRDLARAQAAAAPKSLLDNALESK